MSPNESGRPERPRLTVIRTPRHDPAASLSIQSPAQTNNKKARETFISDIKDVYEEDRFAFVNAAKLADKIWGSPSGDTPAKETCIRAPHKGQTECVIIDVIEARDRCIIKLPRHIEANVMLQNGRNLRNDCPSPMLPKLLGAVNDEKIITFFADTDKGDTIVGEEYIPHTTTLADHADKLLLVPATYADSFVLNSLDLFEQLLQRGIVLIDNRPQNIAVVDSENPFSTQFVYFDLGGLRDFTPTILIRNLYAFAECIERIERIAKTNDLDADLPECRDIAEQLRTFREQSLLSTIEEIRQRPYRQQLPAPIEFPREHYMRMLIQLGDEYRAIRRASNIPLQREAPRPRAKHSVVDRISIHIERLTDQFRRALTRTA